jgi:hypothetical protein
VADANLVAVLFDWRVLFQLANDVFRLGMAAAPDADRPVDANLRSVAMADANAA